MLSQPQQADISLFSLITDVKIISLVIEGRQIIESNHFVVEVVTFGLIPPLSAFHK